jgi:hypothetical protein
VGSVVTHSRSTATWILRAGRSAAPGRRALLTDDTRWKQHCGIRVYAWLGVRVCVCGCEEGGRRGRERVSVDEFRHWRGHLSIGTRRGERGSAEDVASVGHWRYGHGELVRVVGGRAYRVKARDSVCLVNGCSVSISSALGLV